MSLQSPVNDFFNFFGWEKIADRLLVLFRRKNQSRTWCSEREFSRSWLNQEKHVGWLKARKFVCGPPPRMGNRRAIFWQIEFIQTLSIFVQRIDDWKMWIKIVGRFTYGRFRGGGKKRNWLCERVVRKIPTISVPRTTRNFPGFPLRERYSCLVPYRPWPKKSSEFPKGCCGETSLLIYGKKGIFIKSSLLGPVATFHQFHCVYVWMLP